MSLHLLSLWVTLMHTYLIVTPKISQSSHATLSLVSPSGAIPQAPLVPVVRLWLVSLTRTHGTLSMDVYTCMTIPTKLRPTPLSSNSSQRHDATSFSSQDFLILDSAALYMLTDAQNLDAPFKTNASYYNTLTVTLKITQINAHQLA